MAYLAIILGITLLFVLRDSMFKIKEIRDFQMREVLLNEGYNQIKSMSDFHVKNLVDELSKRKAAEETLDMVSEMVLLELE